MIFKEVKLKKDSWYFALVDMMFGPLPTFNNFCPFFWLTMFCVAVSPLFFAGVGIKWAVLRLPLVLDPIGVALAPAGAFLLKGLELVLVRFEAAIDNALCLPLEAATITGISDERLLDLYRHSRYNFMDRYNYDEDYAYRELLSNADDRKTRKLWARMDHKFQAWMNGHGDNWRTELDSARSRVVAQRDDAERIQAVRDAVRAAAAKEADARRRQMLNNIVKYTKIAIPVLLSILALIPAYGIFLLVKLLIGLNWGAICLTILMLPWYLLKGLWWVVTGPFRILMFFSLGQRIAIIMTPIIGAVLIRLSRKCDLELPFIVSFGWLFRKIGRWADSVNEFGEFMIEGFKMWKRDNCPQIIWEE